MIYVTIHYALGGATIDVLHLLNVFFLTGTAFLFCSLHYFLCLLLGPHVNVVPLIGALQPLNQLTKMLIYIQKTTGYKSKQSRCTPWWRLGGEEVYLLLILDLGTRWGWVVSVTPRPHFGPGVGTPGTHCTGGWVGPRAGLDTEATGKVVYLCRGSNPDRPVVQSAVRHYTDWATRLHNWLYLIIFQCNFVMLLRAFHYCDRISV
jgi:hypothetical protein